MGSAAPRSVWLLGLLLGACTVGPNFAPPKEPVPERYTGVVNQAPTGESGPMPSSNEPAAGGFWWQEFHDPELDSLVRQTTLGNLDLKAAYLRIVEARLETAAARAQGLPSLNGAASFTREQFALAGILKSQGIVAGSGASPINQSLLDSLEQPVNVYQVGFDASWELDLFGQVRRSVEAATAEGEGAAEARNDLKLSLAAEVAQTYFQLRASQMLRQTTLELIAHQREIVELTDNRRAHGLAQEPDVDSARAQLSSLSAQLPQFNQGVATASHALSVLTGQPPSAFDQRFGESGELPALPAVIPVGVPSTLARRRPDIRRAEAALHAATAQIGVSMASLFPEVSLTGTFGVRNLGTAYLFDWQSKYYTYGPAVSLPIFHGGALIANVRLSRAQAAEAALDYRKTVLNALLEIEDGLTMLHENARRTEALQDTVKAEQQALDLNIDAYRHGVVSYLSVLTVQLQTVQARQQLVQALLTQSTDLVKLYKALGGGWNDAPDEPVPPAS